MGHAEVDIWFGPGAGKGVFGAGVALGLQQAFEQDRLDPHRVQLVGSSIGCLTSLFLATGNAGMGLEIFQNETRHIVRVSRLIPATGARLINRVARWTRVGESLVSIPSVLNLDHVFQVMDQRTPTIVGQLRESPTKVAAETVDRYGTHRYAELNVADDPLNEVRYALNYFPFTGEVDHRKMDSVIYGYGFAELLKSGKRPLVIVLNAKPTGDSATTIGDVACAVLSFDLRVGKLFLNRRGNRYRACNDAIDASTNVLLVWPPKPVALRDAGSVESSHDLGYQAAERIITFIQSSEF